MQGDREEVGVMNAGHAHVRRDSELMMKMLMVVSVKVIVLTAVIY